MNKRERIAAVIAGRPVDRTPYSLWYHFRLDPPIGEQMVCEELAFYHRYDPDLFKVMHDIPYEMPADLPRIETVEDWAKLPVLEGTTGNFGAQLQAIKQIIAGRGDEGPVVDTIFNVFSVAQKISGGKVLYHLQADPKSVHIGLERIAESLANYAHALIAAHADGIYLAISGAASDTMDEETYRDNFLHYDQQVLDAAVGGTVNVVHQHGRGIYPELTLGRLFHFNVFSWSDRLPENPDICAIRARTDHALLAGIDETTFGTVTPEEIIQQVQDALCNCGRRDLIIAPGCAVPTPPESPIANLKAIRTAVSLRLDTDPIEAHAISSTVVR